MARFRGVAQARHLLLVLGGVAYACLMFSWFVLPAYLTTLIVEFDLSGTQAGVLAGAVPFTYIPLALVTGLVVDRVGARRGIGAAVLVFGVAQCVRGFAPDYPALLGSTLLLGVGATGITFGLPKLASELYASERVGRASSVYLVGAYAGTASAFGLGRPILGPGLGGWRPLFVASGLASLAFAAVWVVAARIAPPGEFGGDDRSAFTLASLRGDVAAVVGHRDLRLLVVVGTMYLLVGHGMQGWLVAILEARGFAPGVAGTVTSLLVVAQVVGVLVIPVLAERLGRRRQGLVACCVAAAVGVSGLLAAPGRALLLVAPVVLVGVGLGGMSPLIRAIPVELDRIGPSLTATAVGLIFAVGEVGGFVGPVLVGSLRDLTGSFAPGIGVLATGAAVAALAGSRLRGLDG